MQRTNTTKQGIGLQNVLSHDRFQALKILTITTYLFSMAFCIVGWLLMAFKAVLAMYRFTTYPIESFGMESEIECDIIETNDQEYAKTETIKNTCKVDEASTSENNIHGHDLKAPHETCEGNEVSPIMLEVSNDCYDMQVVPQKQLGNKATSIIHWRKQILLCYLKSKVEITAADRLANDASFRESNCNIEHIWEETKAGSTGSVCPDELSEDELLITLLDKRKVGLESQPENRSTSNLVHWRKQMLRNVQTSESRNSAVSHSRING